MKNKNWLAILAVALVTTCIPAMADGDDHEGFFIELEGAFSHSGNTGAVVAATGPSDSQICCGTGPFANTLAATDVEDGVDPKITLGYSWGAKGRLSVTYWSFSEDDRSLGLAGGYPEYTWFGIGPAASWYYSFYYEIDWDFTQEVEADSIDLEWSNTVRAGDHVTVDLGVGARVANYDEMIVGRYILDPSGSAYMMPAQRVIEGDGFGLTGSIGVNHEVGDRVNLSSDLRVGFIQTDVDTTQQITDADGYYSPSGTVWLESNSLSDETSLQIEFDAGIDFEITEMIDVGVGYTYRSWSDIGDPTFSRSVVGTDDQAGLRIVGEDRGTVSFSGPRIRVRFRF